MISANLFYRRIVELKREIRNLKTAHIKTATTISTTTKTLTVNFSLTLDSTSGNVYSSKRAVITATPADGGNMVSACYLDGVTPTSIDSRFIETLRLAPQEGNQRFGVAVTAGNASDFETLWGGGSVNLSYDVQVVGSSNFDLSVEYRNIDGGTL